MSQPLPVPEILLEAKNALGESRTDDAIALLNEAIFQLHQRVRELERGLAQHDNGHGRGKAPAAQPRRLILVCIIPGCGCNGEEHA